MQDPLKVGLNFGLEYFNIGDDYISIMASRREQDVLLTEGFEGDDVAGRWNAWSAGELWRFTQDWIGYEGNYGQTVSPIADNGETQFDEVPYQSVIGWKGFTGIRQLQQERPGAGRRGHRASATTPTPRGATWTSIRSTP